MKKIISLIFVVLLLNGACFAGFEPITVVRPHTITVGTEVFIGYDPIQTPCLESLVNFEGLTDYIDIDSSNNIEITISALAISPCFNIPADNPPYQFFSLGELPVGAYRVQMFWVHPGTSLPVPSNFMRGVIGGNIDFQVLAPVTIPMLSFYPLLFFGAILILIALFILRIES